MSQYDVVVVGGAPWPVATLALCQPAARSLSRTPVRRGNAPAVHMHGYLFTRWHPARCATALCI
jgi:hypothetical protein